jgi:hypothetical protein
MDSRHSIPPRQRATLLGALVGLMAACGLGWAAEVQPGDGKQPAATQAEAVHPWRPFEPVKRPVVPTHWDAGANPVDAFLAQARAERGLKARPEASREVLLRRAFMDLVGVNPTPVERTEFLKDEAPGAYERLVERLLVDPRHGERWGRHWMDVWRYSDWAGWADGNQVRDSKPHIWRWRDWIVESLNTDKPYDRMLAEMVAADELAPEDPGALRATGFLVRNYKLLSREQWLEDTVKHTFQAFLGVTVGCAKCHDHMTDPIPQRDYYAARAIFEPHQIRTDRVPGQLDTGKDGLARAYDATNAPTYLFVRGDERHPLTNEVVAAAVPTFLGGRLEIQTVNLPRLAARPDDRESVRADVLAAADRAVADAQAEMGKVRAETNAALARIERANLALDLALKKQASVAAVLVVERARETAGEEATLLATNATLLQRMERVASAKLQLHEAHQALAAAATNKVAEARKKQEEASTQWTQAVEAMARPLDAGFTPRPTETFPEVSSGRRSAFARWLGSQANPLTARVAVNHVWARHFGRGLVPSVADFGRNGRPASHPALLDWLAAEFMEPSWVGADGRRAPAWSLRHLHRLLVTSHTYRMASTPDEEDLRRDPDNIGLWRMNSRRLEAEAVRDNLLHIAGTLDPAMGGPDIDHRDALKSQRRSIYLRSASEKQAEFLQIFDGPSVTECYERRPSVIPQQALALANSELVFRQARALAPKLLAECGQDRGRLVESAFVRILGRQPTGAEARECDQFLTAPVPASAASAEKAGLRAVENLVLVLFNHSDFVTIR